MLRSGVCLPAHTFNSDLSLPRSEKSHQSSLLGWQPSRRSATGFAARRSSQSPPAPFGASTPATRSRSKKVLHAAEQDVVAEALTAVDVPVTSLWYQTEKPAVRSACRLRMLAASLRA